MPGGDRTGPQGEGPKTGRGFGYCSSYDLPGYIVPAFASAKGRGRGQGGGFGWRRRFFATGQAGWDYPRYAPPTQEEVLETLKADADWLKGQLEAINKRIEELEK